MNIILASGKRDNFKKSIENPIDNTLLEKAKFDNSVINLVLKNSINNKIYCWALVPTSNAKRCITDMKPDDYIFFSQGSSYNDNNSGNFIYYGQVICSVYNSNLNRLLWSTSEESNPEKRNFIIFIKDIKKIVAVIPKKEVMDVIGFPKDTLQVPRLLTSHQVDLFWNKYFTYLDINDRKYLAKASLYSPADSEVLADGPARVDLKKFIHASCIADLDFKTKVTKTRKETQASHSNKTKFSEDVLTHSSKKVIGWIGEQVAYNTILNNGNLISSLLEINQNDILDIEWFNKNIDISKPDWKDNSINKGCDINIKLKNSGQIKIEVKSSYSNINEITLTGNELRTMSSADMNDYFIILISKLSNLHLHKNPQMIILNSFTNEISNTYLKFSKSHTLYVKDIISKYKITL